MVVSCHARRNLESIVTSTARDNKQWSEDGRDRQAFHWWRDMKSVQCCDLSPEPKKTATAARRRFEINGQRPVFSTTIQVQHIKWSIQCHKGNATDSWWIPIFTCHIYNWKGPCAPFFFPHCSYWGFCCSHRARSVEMVALVFAPPKNGSFSYCNTQKC